MGYAEMADGVKVSTRSDDAPTWPGLGEGAVTSVDPRVVLVWIPPGAHIRLTAREILVLRSVANGLTDHKIATDLGMTIGQVRYDVRRAGALLGAPNRVSTVVNAIAAHVVIVEREA